MRYYYTSVRMAKIKKMAIPSVVKNMKQLQLLYTLWEHKMVQSLWNTSNFLKSKAKTCHMAQPFHSGKKGKYMSMQRFVHKCSQQFNSQ